MKALAINCTLKKSPDTSNTEALLRSVTEQLEQEGVDVDVVRAVDLDIGPGVVSEAVHDGDDWPDVHAKVLGAQILIIASPTWLGQPSSVAKRVLERMDAMLSETDDDGRPVAYNRVAGVVVTGNEDGAHHVISEITGGLQDIGYTIPGQAWTYWNQGPGPGPSFLEGGRGHDWSRSTGRAMAANLLGVAGALQERPLGPPPQ
ncbi:flavodoxin family protein [Streptomyces sp. S12]|uniref:Flavodoxin family protein n=2 Tax=unclassified Streptomyces TaxID=2593676 RepID=A0A6G3QNY2_9ACTN|nr:MULTISPECIES: NAD(P)H-dependent oxidoreductase [unclassified Streptomyces]MBM7093599.1 flavodoxin family protein [Streptomyces sp. S12]NEA85055.1 flavodoxin family protein [Streptomyces sp. SID14436]NEC82495.1 flavodoxin family protein [Streptomyces sp. SID7958]